jgi:hypothetical protein
LCREGPRGVPPEPGAEKQGNRPEPTAATFHDDPLFPGIEKAVADILASGNEVAPIDVLIRMSLLAPEDLKDWRRGRVPYLEKAINCNLTRLARLLRILRFHAHDLNLLPSVISYVRWGKGPRQRLRFTKTGERRIEQAYTRHFVWPGKGRFHPPERSKATHRRRVSSFGPKGPS